MCSLVVSILDSPAVDPRSNPGSGSALLKSLRSENHTPPPHYYWLNEVNPHISHKNSLKK